ncbi:MAG: phage portal protein [Clostridia bacterium]|nr:phage portal protein [Clostridia bacterium]
MRECLRKLGYETIGSDFDKKIDCWREWYGGKVSSFHSYYQYNGKKKVKRERATLGMAKRVCEDWANLLMNEKVEISLPDDALTKKVRTILDKNNFKVKANQLIELSFALGTGAFVEFLDKGKPSIDFVRADMIFPISWDNGRVTECAFGSVKNVLGKKCYYIQLHVLEDGEYVIKNRAFDEKTKREVKLPDGVLADFKTGSVTPLFQIVTPNIVNSYDLNSPMGISVFANAIDILKGVDLVYDSYNNEFRLGKKRIIVPVGMAQLESEKTGFMPVFDDNDTEFYAFTDKNVTDLKEINMEIRAKEHTEGLKQNLNLLSDLCGLGKDRYTANERNEIKTATEVISEESALYQNLKKHEIVLKRAVCDLVRALLFLDGENYEDLEVLVDFDDGIIHDSSLEFEQNLKLVQNGVMKPYEFRMRWFNETENQAKNMILKENDAIGNI